MKMPVTEIRPPAATDDELTHAIWQSVTHLKENFKLTDGEMQRLLGDFPRSTYYKGIRTQTVRVSRDTRDRVSLLLGIYKALRVIFVDTQQAVTWIDRENMMPPFNGRAPRAYMTSGSQIDLARVRSFLDYWRG